MSYYGATSIDTGNAVLNDLVATRGMTGMMNTIFLIISAVTFGGALVGSGMLQSLTELLTRYIKRRVTMVSATVGTGIFSNMITGDQYLSIILTSSLYKNLYKKKGYESKLLSRSVEDSATVVSVLVPWNSCGMTQSTVLGVSTLTYLPYCLFNLLSPVMSIIIAAIGYKIVKKSK
jgi:NhaC family Na+:H+ antiporter